MRHQERKGAPGVKIVKDEKVEKKITLPTMAVDKTNCEQKGRTAIIRTSTIKA
jgi:hypothetical protein